jgi:hypothetical protein
MPPPIATCRRFPTAALLPVLAALAFPAASAALPVFSRQEPAPCARCHVSAPVLNAAGERFLRAGYRTAGEEAHAVARPGALPVSVVLEAGEVVSRVERPGVGGTRVTSTPGGFEQHVLDVHAAGTAGERVSFRLQAGLDSAASSLRTKAAFVQFDGVVPGGVLAIRAGTFDAGLPFLSAARRPTRREYLAPVEVAARGVELNGSHAAWGYAIGMMNSSRSGNGAGGGFNRLEDTFLRVTREFHGQEVGGRMLFDRQDSNISWHAWLQRLQAQIGGRFGADRIWIVPAYTLDRFDDRPAPGIHQRHQYVLLETLGLLGARRDWTLAARAEHEHTTPTVASPGEDHDLEALRLAREFTPNAALAVEWSRVATAGGSHESRVDASVRLAY